MAGPETTCPNCGAAVPAPPGAVCPACGHSLPPPYRGPGGIGYFVGVYALLMLLTVLLLGLYVWLAR